MRGNTVIHNPIRVDTKEYVTIPTNLYKLHKFVTLTADVIFLNGTKILITP